MPGFRLRLEGFHFLPFCFGGADNDYKISINLLAAHLADYGEPQSTPAGDGANCQRMGVAMIDSALMRKR